MKKILPVVAVAALFASGSCLAQGQTSGYPNDSFGADPVVNMGPPVVYYPAEGTTIMSPSYNTNTVIAVPSGAVATYVYVREPEVLVGNTRGPIKLGGPKFDSQGRRIYSPRDVR